MMTISEIKIEILDLEDKLKEESKLTGYDSVECAEIRDEIYNLKDSLEFAYLHEH